MNFRTPKKQEMSKGTLSGLSYIFLNCGLICVVTNIVFAYMFDRFAPISGDAMYFSMLSDTYLNLIPPVVFAFLIPAMLSDVLCKQIEF